ncbi:hypothetical protein RSOLAG22IIIB_10099 [Rhizoctonia solani]|uniref:Uncharacterized protein n=1 Tax=Rhizoctonia solani TaxID=456999 RepID=A0A0K6G1H9_9AGAM|nr:hypothetical protein RSOLAG22IIIB_10099 [Rhizoctonia solani]
MSRNLTDCDRCNGSHRSHRPPGAMRTTDYDPTDTGGTLQDSVSKTPTTLSESSHPPMRDSRHQDPPCEPLHSIARVREVLPHLKGRFKTPRPLPRSKDDPEDFDASAPSSSSLSTSFSLSALSALLIALTLTVDASQLSCSTEEQSISLDERSVPNHDRSTVSSTRSQQLTSSSTSTDAAHRPNPPLDRPNCSLDRPNHYLDRPDRSFDHQDRLSSATQACACSLRPDDRLRDPVMLATTPQQPLSTPEGPGKVTTEPSPPLIDISTSTTPEQSSSTPEVPGKISEGPDKVLIEPSPTSTDIDSYMTLTPSAYSQLINQSLTRRSEYDELLPIPEWPASDYLFHAKAFEVAAVSFRDQMERSIQRLYDLVTTDSTDQALSTVPSSMEYDDPMQEDPGYRATQLSLDSSQVASHPHTTTLPLLGSIPQGSSSNSSRYSSNSSLHRSIKDQQTLPLPQELTTAAKVEDNIQFIESPVVTNGSQAPKPRPKPPEYLDKLLEGLRRLEQPVPQLTSATLAPTLEKSKGTLPPLKYSSEESPNTVCIKSIDGRNAAALAAVSINPNAKDMTHATPVTQETDSLASRTSAQRDLLRQASEITRNTPGNWSNAQESFDSRYDRSDSAYTHIYAIYASEYAICNCHSHFPREFDFLKYPCPKFDPVYC